jgi:hypothetical protein
VPPVAYPARGCKYTVEPSDGGAAIHDTLLRDCIMDEPEGVLPLDQLPKMSLLDLDNSNPHKISLLGPVLY